MKITGLAEFWQGLIGLFSTAQPCTEDLALTHAQTLQHCKDHIPGFRDLTAILGKIGRRDI